MKMPLITRVVIIAASVLSVSMVSAQHPSTHPVPGHGTPDEMPPAEEGVCDEWGGRVWGLCVAYCEAQDCDEPENADRRSCRILEEKLVDLIGGVPCGGEPEPDPNPEG